MHLLKMTAQLDSREEHVIKTIQNEFSSTDLIKTFQNIDFQSDDNTLTTNPNPQLFKWRRTGHNI